MSIIMNYSTNNNLPMNFVIAIASHERFKDIQSKTLDYLKKHLPTHNGYVNFDNVYIFTSTKSYKQYSSNLPQLYQGINIIKSKDSILDARNHIIEFFEDKTCILEMDDDIENIEIMTKNCENKTLSNFVEIVEDSFNKVDYDGLFGFNANNNNFFSSCKDKYGLYSIINSCCGYVNDKSIKLTCKEKEDFERTILFYRNNKKILKRDYIGIKTNYWRNKGGIQAHYDFNTRKLVQSDAAQRLVDKYPSYCFKVERKNGIVDVRFRRLNHSLQ